MSKKTPKRKYSKEEFELYLAAYNRLKTYIADGTMSPIFALESGRYLIEAEDFRAHLRKEISDGFPIDFMPGGQGFPLFKEQLRPTIGLGQDISSPLLQVFVKTPKAALCGIPHVLLEEGANPNVQNRHGKTALYDAAAIACNPELVELLLDYGADPNVVKNNGASIFSATAKFYMVAALKFDDSYARAMRILQLLLAAGADPWLGDQWSSIDPMLTKDPQRKQDVLNLVETTEEHRQQMLNTSVVYYDYEL